MEGNVFLTAFFWPKVFNYSSKTFIVLWGRVREVLISCRYVIKEAKPEKGCLLFVLSTLLNKGESWCKLGCQTSDSLLGLCTGTLRDSSGSFAMKGLLLCSGLAITSHAALEVWSPPLLSSSRARKGVGLTSSSKGLIFSRSTQAQESITSMCYVSV